VKYFENKERLTIDEFVDSIGRQRYDPELMKRDEGVMRGFFFLMDINCDGYLQKDEFESIFAKLGVQDTSFAEEAFKALDVNGGGKLSVKAYIDGFHDFFYSQDENSPNKHFFGPLVD